MGHTLRSMSRDVESHPWGQDAWPDELPLHDHERALDLNGLHSYTAQRLEPLLPGLLDNLEGGVSLCWDTEPYARGGGAWFRPGQSGLREVIAAPQGRIHFAGEATSPWPGWVQGAFDSARRAAAEILERSAHATA